MCLPAVFCRELQKISGSRADIEQSSFVRSVALNFIQIAFKRSPHRGFVAVIIHVAKSFGGALEIIFGVQRCRRCRNAGSKNKTAGRTAMKHKAVFSAPENALRVAY